jgi:Zn-finger nucleic acid-binding protein
MDCPVCKNVKLVMSDRQGIEIDYCPTCRGVWLDRGELDKIIERSVPGAAAPAAAAPQQHYPQQHHPQQHYPQQQGYYKKKKKEGFLGELFDFD